MNYVFAFVALFCVSTAHALPVNLVTCARIDNDMQNTEVFAVQIDGLDTQLEFQKIVNGYIAVDQILMNNLICEKSKVKGFESVICFSKAGSDKMILDIDPTSKLPYNLVLMASSSSTKAGLSQAGLKMDTSKDVWTLSRKYSATNSNLTCRF